MGKRPPCNHGRVILAGLVLLVAVVLTAGATLLVTEALREIETLRQATGPDRGVRLFKLLTTWVIDLGLVLLAAGMIMAIYRLLRDPHLADRALAVDTLGVQLIGVVILLIARFETPLFIDGVLVLSLLSFAGTVAIAQYIGKPHLRPRPSPGDDDSAAREAGT